MTKGARRVRKGALGNRRGASFARRRAPPLQLHLTPSVTRLASCLTQRRLRGQLPAARACLARATNPGLPAKNTPTVTYGPSGTGTGTGTFTARPAIQGNALVRQPVAHERAFQVRIFERSGRQILSRGLSLPDPRLARARTAVLVSLKAQLPEASAELVATGCQFGAKRFVVACRT